MTKTAVKDLYKLAPHKYNPLPYLNIFGVSKFLHGLANLFEGKKWRQKPWFDGWYHGVIEGQKGFTREEAYNTVVEMTGLPPFPTLQDILKERGF